MPLDTQHPQYIEMLDDWCAMRDTYAGERAVKQRGFRYLPPTEGMVEDGIDSRNYSTAATNFSYADYFSTANTRGSRGWRRYVSYRGRALFYDFVSEAVNAAIGIMHHRPPTITLPKALEPMLQRATLHGESLQALIRMVNEQQLVMGRVGLLLDLPRKPDPANPLPHFALYHAERCINWDEGQADESLPRMNLVVLDETEMMRTDEFQWDERKKWRVLALGDLKTNEEPGTPAVYRQALVEENAAQAIPEEAWTTPMVRGVTLEEIPFRFVNAQDLHPDVDDPPLMGLARMCLAIYRGDADYRLGLFQQAQATLVRIGVLEGDDAKTGPGSSIDLPINGDAKYIVAPSAGLEAQRQALADDKMMAANRAMTLIDTRSGQKEAAETLRIRVAAQTASLNQIAIAAAAAVEQLLKVAASWVGANPEEVSVKPNLEFASRRMGADELLKLVTAKNMGAPLSMRSMHALANRGELTELTFEDEQAEIEGEEPIAGVTAPEVEEDDDGDEDPDPDAE